MCLPMSSEFLIAGRKINTVNIAVALCTYIKLECIFVYGDQCSKLTKHRLKHLFPLSRWEVNTQKLTSESNPTIVNYNANVVKVYTATCSLACFENKFFFLYFEKRSSLLQRWHCSCEFSSRLTEPRFIDS
jgi:hypothetical protein